MGLHLKSLSSVQRGGRHGHLQRNLPAPCPDCTHSLAAHDDKGCNSSRFNPKKGKFEPCGCERPRESAA